MILSPEITASEIENVQGAPAPLPTFFRMQGLKASAPGPPFHTKSSLRPPRPLLAPASSRSPHSSKPSGGLGGEASGELGGSPEITASERNPKRPRRAGIHSPPPGPLSSKPSRSHPPPPQPPPLPPTLQTSKGCPSPLPPVPRQSCLAPSAHWDLSAGMLVRVQVLRFNCAERIGCAPEALKRPPNAASAAAWRPSRLVLLCGQTHTHTRHPKDSLSQAGLFESRIARIARRQKAAIRAESRGAH